MTERQRPFSERVGVSQPGPPLVGRMGENLRNSIWNLLRGLIPLSDSRSRHFTSRAVSILAQDFFKVAITSRVDSEIRSVPMAWFELQFFQLPWFRIYDLLEYAVHAPVGVSSLPPHAVIAEANIVLERENSGYRFVSGYLTPITNPAEIQTVEDARAKASSVGLDTVREHIDAALRALAQKPNPEHRNAIKEAISAVEAAAALIGKGTGKGLDGPLRELADRTDMHPAMREGFIKLYGWTSDDDGIRHALLDPSKVDGVDARFMVIACSAFVHFLIQKAEAVGLLKSRQ